MSAYTELDSAGGVDSIAELAHRAANTEAPEAFDLHPSTSIVVRTTRNDEAVKSVDLERFLAAPRRQRGEATVTDPADFANYVNRLSSAHTTVWADDKNYKVTAVFNDHGETRDEAGPAGWRDHTATLVMQVDPDWRAWMAVDGKLDSQEWFAEFLEDHARTIVSPDAATMFEVARSFQARSSAQFSKVIRVDNGDVQLSWNETTDAKVNSATKGNFEVPQSFTVQLAPFLGVPPRQLEARLRWRLREGSLYIGFSLLRPDLVIRDAFGDVIATLRDELAGAPVLLGTAPQSITTTQASQ